MSKAKPSPNLQIVRELADILNETDLSQIDYKTDGVKITVRRGGETVHVAAPQAAAPAPSTAPAVSAPAAPAEATPAANAITSPMVGTAYIRPSPDADLFANVGDKVSEGDTIMLVEAMKTFNPITAPRSGTLTAVYIEDAQGVEFADPLFAID